MIGKFVDLRNTSGTGGTASALTTEQAEQLMSTATKGDVWGAKFA